MASPSEASLLSCCAPLYAIDVSDALREASFVWQLLLVKFVICSSLLFGEGHRARRSKGDQTTRRVEAIRFGNDGGRFGGVASPIASQRRSRSIKADRSATGNVILALKRIRGRLKTYHTFQLSLLLLAVSLLFLLVRLAALSFSKWQSLSGAGTPFQPGSSIAKAKTVGFTTGSSDGPYGGDSKFERSKEIVPREALPIAASKGLLFPSPLKRLRHNISLEKEYGNKFPDKDSYYNRECSCLNPKARPKCKFHCSLLLLAYYYIQLFHSNCHKSHQLVCLFIVHFLALL